MSLQGREAGQVHTIHNDDSQDQVYPSDWRICSAFCSSISVDKGGFIMTKRTFDRPATSLRQAD
jgi:hypothetical protein